MTLEAPVQTPVQVLFRNMDRSAAVEDRVRELADKLENYFDNIVSCHVAVEAPHRHRRKGNRYHVRIDLTVPDAELAVNRGGSHDHEDVYVAVRDAFAAMTRRLEDYARRHRHDVKRHTGQAHGRIREIMPAADYGVIETADGRELEFTRNSVVDDDFDRLNVGDEVRFAEAQSDRGPAASTVYVVDKRHREG